MPDSPFCRLRDIFPRPGEVFPRKGELICYKPSDASKLALRESWRVS
ncbi:hypothetical protein HMPREF9436_00532, partial [Faecalibacterium cf. prausnitzii KLE1255]